MPPISEVAQKWTSMTLMSCDLETVFKQIYECAEVRDPLQVEDQRYMNNIITMSRLSKQFTLLGQYEMAIFYTKKALKIADQLHATRKDNFPEY